MINRRRMNEHVESIMRFKLSMEPDRILAVQSAYGDRIKVALEEAYKMGALEGVQR